MAEIQTHKNKLRLPTKKEFMVYGSAVLSAATFATGKAEAKSFAQPNANNVPTFSGPLENAGRLDVPPHPAKGAWAKGIRDWGRVELQIENGKRPNVAMAGILELPAGTFLRYGPHKKNAGMRIPKGHTGYLEFGQMVVVDGRVVLRGVLNSPEPKVRPYNDGYDSRFVDPRQKGVKVWYTPTMDPNKGYPYTLPIQRDPEGYFASNAEFFQQVPIGMQLGKLIVLPNNEAKAFAHREWVLDPTPGRIPRISDVHP